MNVESSRRVIVKRFYSRAQSLLNIKRVTKYEISLKQEVDIFMGYV